MKNYLLVIQYNGLAYYGWNMQPKKATIISELTKAFKKFYSGKIQIQGSGRTDRGVHALAQCATIKLEIDFNPVKLKKILNSYLPADIRIIKVKIVAYDFHARYSAKEKTYLYLINTSFENQAILANLYWFIKEPINLTKMCLVAKLLIGKHDFKSFAKITKKDKIDTIRTISKITIKKENDKISITITGNGFLRHMVRKIVGALVAIGTEKKSNQYIVNGLKQKKSSVITDKAPACGLYLKNVKY